MHLHCYINARYRWSLIVPYCTTRHYRFHLKIALVSSYVEMKLNVRLALNVSERISIQSALHHWKKDKHSLILALGVSHQIIEQGLFTSVSPNAF